MHKVTSGSFCTIAFSHFGMLPFLNFVLIEEFEKICTSCTGPGHFAILRSATVWVFKEYLPLRLM